MTDRLGAFSGALADRYQIERELGQGGRGMLGQLLDPAMRTRLLAAPILGALASDSAVALVSKRGLARAALLRGRTDEAIEAARRAVTMHSVASDYYEGPDNLAILAEAHAAAGHTDSALAQLRVLVAHPSMHRGGMITKAPGYAALRNDPRFLRIVQESRNE